MTDITTQLATFFVDSSDVTITGEDVPHTSDGNTVTPLVDGYNYFHALRQEVDSFKTSTASGKFFYFANWWLALAAIPAGQVAAGGGSTATAGSTAWPVNVDPITPFKLDDQQGGPYPDFIDELGSMAANGTEIRALPWVSPLLAQVKEAQALVDLYYVVASNMLSVQALRARTEKGMDKSACLDVIGHALGSMHLKMVVCGDDTGGRAYVSGIDFVNTRIDKPGHPGGTSFGWHDAGAKVEGPAVQGIYDFFRDIWNEVPDRSLQINQAAVPSKAPGTMDVPDRTFSSGMSGGMHVQVLRTGPQMNFAFDATARLPLGAQKRLAAGFKTPAWGFAPNGIFEFEASVKKAIAGAQQYIYIEDQEFRSWPIMEALRAALLANPQLKLIMVHHGDPADGDDFPYTTTAINEHLADGLPDDLSAQVAWAERTDNTVIHSKTWIIDDQFVIIGSANCYRRSQFTDGEISIAVLDEDSTPNNLAVRYRLMLWGEHCGLLDDAATAVIADINDAIRIWNADWTVGGGSPPAASPTTGLAPMYQLKGVPFQAGTNPDQWPVTEIPLPVTDDDYDLHDPDSTLEY